MCASKIFRSHENYNENEGLSRYYIIPTLNKDNVCKNAYPTVSDNQKVARLSQNSNLTYRN